MKNNNSNASHKLTKNDLIFYYQQIKFPTDLISQQVSKIGDLIFSLDTQEPENVQTTKKKIKLSNCFIIEDELESKKGFVKKGKVNGPLKGKIENHAWRRTEPDDPGFFDDFRGKSDETKVFAFKRNIDLVEKKEMSISIEKSVLLDHMDIQDQEFFGIKKKENKDKQVKAIIKNTDIVLDRDGNVNSSGGNGQLPQQAREITATADDLFSEQGIFSNLSAPVTAKKENFEEYTPDPDPKKINFKNAFRVNDYLKYGKDQPLWYIFHPVAKSSFGPCSTLNLEEMYIGNMVNGQSEIRFIDIYNLKNQKPFTFFKLKELDNPKIVENIDISGLLTNAVALNCKIQIEKNHINN